MSSCTQLLTVIYVFLLLLSKTCVNGFTEWCLPGAEVNLTGVSPDFSGYRSKYGLSFPPNATLVENGVTVGCPCKFLTCVQSCCPPGYATHKNHCVKDIFTPLYIAQLLNGSTVLPSWRKDGPRMLSYRYQRVLIYHTLEFISLEIDVTEELNDGSFSQGSVKSDLGAFCILRPTNSHNIEIGVYATYVHIFQGRLVAVSFGICLICAIAIFIIYTIISDLKNLRGSILRCYLASYIVCIFLLILQVRITTVPLEQSEFNTEVMELICFFGAAYFGFACVFWTSVMSFDTWKAFRRFEPIPDVHIKQEETKKFFWYSIYAWGGSFLLFVIAVCGLWVVVLYLQALIPDEIGDNSWRSTLLAIVLLPVVIIIICNKYFYGSTALRIKRRKKESAHLVDGVNKHHKENRGWFNLYLRLYVIMGGAAILWIPVWYVDVRAYLIFVVIVEALQGVLIFITCVWRDEVKRYFSRLFNRMLHASAHLLRRNSTPAPTI